MKKIISLLLLSAMFITLAACSKEPEENDNATTTSAQSTTTAETTKYANDDLGEYDFKEYTFNLLSRASGYIDVVEEKGEVLDDAIYARNTKIEDRFNFNFKEVLMEGSDMSKARNALLAGGNEYDMMVIRCPDAFTYAQEGLIVPIKELPKVDLSKPYWDSGLSKELTIGNKMFFASGAFDLPSYHHLVALLFNKQMTVDLGTPDLYKIVSDGKWTLDKFAEIGLTARKDINGDGKYDNEDRHGFLGVDMMVAANLWLGCGVKTIYKDKDDIPYFAAKEAKFVEVFSKILEKVRTNELWYRAPSSSTLNDPVIIEMFKSGKALFLEINFMRIKDLRDMDIDFGILPYPKYDEQQEEYLTRLGWAELVCIPSSGSEETLERTSVILEALCCESAKTVVPAYYELALKTKGTRDSESEAMIDLLVSNRVFDYGDTILSNDLRGGTLRSIFQENKTTLVSDMQSIEAKINTQLKNMIDAFAKLD